MLKINFLGDSITEGCMASKPENGYVSLIGKMLNAEVRNYGIGGTRIAWRPDPSEDPRWDMFFGDRVKDMNHDADLVVVFGGTNDWGRGACPFGKLGDTTPKTFYGAMDYLINELLKFYWKNQLIFVIPLYREGENERYGDGTKKYANMTLPEYRAAMEEVLNKYGIDYIDFKDEIGKGENNPLLADGLHPNDKGYKKIAEILGAYIAKRIKQ